MDYMAVFSCFICWAIPSLILVIQQLLCDLLLLLQATHHKLTLLVHRLQNGLHDLMDSINNLLAANNPAQFTQGRQRHSKLGHWWGSRAPP